MGSAKHPVKATETTLELVEELKRSGGGRVTELSEKLGLSKSAVHNHLSTLESHGYIVKEGDLYRIGLKFLDLGGFRRHQMHLFRTAEPEVNRLAEETGELANLLTEENGKGVYLYRAKGEDALDLDTYVGMRKHLHTTALGKAILAFLDETRVDAIIEQHGLPKMTERTIANEDELYENLAHIRERGVAFDDEEATAGVRCAAAPVMINDRVLGAISISAPTSRMQGDRFESVVPDKLKSAANVIELNIKYP